MENQLTSEQCLLCFCFFREVDAFSLKCIVIIHLEITTIISIKMENDKL